MKKRTCAACGLDVTEMSFCPYCNGQTAEPVPVIEIDQTDRTWILGASDPEMAAIENLLAVSGQKVLYAMVNDKRCHPGNAYAADWPAVDGDLVLVECGFAAPDEGRLANIRSITRIDHHKPGDAGYGQPPAEFLRASSLGQVIEFLARIDRLPWSKSDSVFCAGLHVTLHGRQGWAVAGAGARGSFRQMVPEELVLAACADHCLAAAYRGECAEVDPERLCQWRIRSRAAFQGCTVETLEEKVKFARKVLRDGRPGRDCPECGGSGCDQYSGTETCQYCGGYGRFGPYEVVRFDGLPAIDELPEAAAREGIPYVATVFDRDGREKVVLGAAPPEMVKRFLAGEPPFDHFATLGRGLYRGPLDGYYGDPERGFAGGYVPTT